MFINVLDDLSTKQTCRTITRDDVCVWRVHVSMNQIALLNKKDQKFFFMLVCVIVRGFVNSFVVLFLERT